MLSLSASCHNLKQIDQHGLWHRLSPDSFLQAEVVHVFDDSSSYRLRCISIQNKNKMFRSFKGIENIHKKERKKEYRPYRGFGNLSLISEPIKSGKRSLN